MVTVQSGRPLTTIRHRKDQIFIPDNEGKNIYIYIYICIYIYTHTHTEHVIFIAFP